MSDLSGLAFVISGALSEPRKAIEAKIRAAGGAVGAKVSGKTTHLVTTQVDFDTGSNSKVKDATAKGVHVVTEDYLSELLAGGSAAAGTMLCQGSDAATARIGGAKKGAKKKRKSTEAAPKPAAKKAKTAAAGATANVVTERFECEGSKYWEIHVDGCDVVVAYGAIGAKPRGSRKTMESAAKAKAEMTKSINAKTKKGYVAAGSSTAAVAMDTAPAPEPEKAAPKKKAAPAPKKAVKTEPAAAAASPSKAAGGTRVDRSMPDGSSYEIVDDFHTKLMQTNLGANNNKFYIAQLLQKGASFAVWTRWGRLGENGQSKLLPASNFDDGVKIYGKKFKDKTKNNWEDRGNFVKHSGKYQLVETTGEDDGDSADAALGRLTEDQIKKGQAVLDEIKAALSSGGKGAKIKDLSSSFYSFIPTTSGRVAPPPLNDEAIVGEKEALLEFWLRMGFEDMKVDDLSPIDGVMDIPLPTTLKAAASTISDAHSISSSVTKGGEMADRKAGSPFKPMDKELYGAILLYTGNSIYSALNRALRGGNRSQVKKYFKYLRLFLEAMSCMSAKKRTLWRGISVDLYKDYEPGKVITWWSVSSTTSDEQVARNFMAGCGGACTLLTIECETAMDVSALSFYSHEKESLLAPGTQLEILKRTRKGKVTEIHAREVGQAIS